MRHPISMLCLCAVVLTAILAFNTNQATAANPAEVRGAATFASHGCAHCHGPAGVGGDRGPDLQLVRKRFNAAQMTIQIHDGGKGMPAYGDQLTAPEISDVVVYLRAKRKLIKVPPPS